MVRTRVCTHSYTYRGWIIQPKSHAYVCTVALINSANLKKNPFYKDATQKSAFVVQWGIAVELVPRRPIFEKCPHLREKGGVLTKIWAHGE